MLWRPEARVEDIRSLGIESPTPRIRWDHPERDVTEEEVRITVTWRLFKPMGLFKWEWEVNQSIYFPFLFSNHPYIYTTLQCKEPVEGIPESPQLISGTCFLMRWTEREKSRNITVHPPLCAYTKNLRSDDLKALRLTTPAWSDPEGNVDHMNNW